MKIGKHFRSSRARLYFIAFIVSVGIHKANYLIYNVVGFDLQAAIGVSLLAFPLIFLVAAVNTSQNIPNVARLVVKDRLLFLTLILIVFDLFLGLISGNSLSIISQELWSGLIILLGYAVAYDKNLINLFREKLLLLIFILFSLLTYLGTSFLREHLEGYENLSISITTATLAYEVSSILDIWPIIFLTRWFSSKNMSDRLLAFVPVILFLLFQLYFVKRAPTVRALSIVAIAVFYFYYLKGSGDFVIRLILGIFVLYLGIVFLTPDNLLARFQTEDNARQAEAQEMLAQFGFFDLVFGKGLGGYFLLNDGAGIIEVNKEGSLGKHILHIGFFYPILKGGLLLFLAVFSHIILSVYNGLKRIRESSSNILPAFIYLLVYSVFRLIEGPISPGVVFDGFLFGLSLGLLNKKVTR